MTAILLASLWLSTLHGADIPNKKETSQPNIVLIMADDLGYGAQWLKSLGDANR
jgi:hypothetical protein